jgi:hypothetical protein
MGSVQGFTWNDTRMFHVELMHCDPRLEERTLGRDPNPAWVALGGLGLEP